MNSSTQDPFERSDYRSLAMDQKVANLFVPAAERYAFIQEDAKTHGVPPISIGPFEAQLMRLLLKMIGAKRGVEVGTLTGYSAAWLAESMPADGKLISIERDAVRAEMARENMQRLGLATRVEVRTGAGQDVLGNLEDLRDLDFVFVDADKQNYPAYFRWAMPRLRSGGLILGDNAYIWGGMNHLGLKPEDVPYPTPALHTYDRAEFTGMSEAWQLVAQDPQFESLVFPTGDGLLVARKK